MTQVEYTEFLDLLKQLIRSPSVVGAEYAFFHTLQRELEEAGATVTRYEGLLVAQGDRPESRLISAHIDRHGLICTGPNEFQYAAFVARNRGDLLGNSLSENTFRSISGRFKGEAVMAYEPWSGVYLGTGIIDNSYLCEHRGNIVFEVSGLEHVVAGTSVAYQDRLVMENGCMIAQLDNVLTAAALVCLFRKGYRGTVFFTAQEEAGRSWRYLLEWFQRFGSTTNQLIVVDTSPYKNRADAEEQQVVLRHCDANGCFDPDTVAQLENICRDLDVSYSFKDDYFERRNIKRKAENRPLLSMGSTELGRLVKASEGAVQGATIQVPTTGYHTSEETASVDACQAFLKVLSAYALDV